MKKIIVLITTLIALMISLTGCQNTTLEKKKYQTEEDIKKIVLSEISMNVLVKKNTSDDIQVSYYEKEKEYYYYFSLNSSTNTLRIERKEKIGWFKGNYNFSESYKTTILVPESFTGDIVVDSSYGETEVNDLVLSNLNIDKSSGSTSLNNIKITEKVDINNSNGELKVSSSDIKILNYKVSNGDIKISSSTFSEKLYLEADNGKVLVQNTEAASFDVNTTNGKIELQEVDFTTICNVEAVTGTIALTLKGKKDEYSLSAETKTGVVNIQNYKSGNKNIYLDTTVGKITVNFLG